jgi:hypothetical protein
MDVAFTEKASFNVSTDIDFLFKLNLNRIVGTEVRTTNEALVLVLRTWTASHVLIAGQCIPGRPFLAWFGHGVRVLSSDELYSRSAKTFRARIIPSLPNTQD